MIVNGKIEKTDECAKTCTCPDKGLECTTENCWQYKTYVKENPCLTCENPDMCGVDGWIKVENCKLRTGFIAWMKGMKIIK